jgi:hypothetical protein
VVEKPQKWIKKYWGRGKLLKKTGRVEDKL